MAAVYLAADMSWQMEGNTPAETILYFAFLFPPTLCSFSIILK